MAHQRGLGRGRGEGGAKYQSCKRKGQEQNSRKEECKEKKVTHLKNSCTNNERKIRSYKLKFLLRPPPPHHFSNGPSLNLRCSIQQSDRFYLHGKYQKLKLSWKSLFLIAFLLQRCMRTDNRSLPFSLTLQLCLSHGIEFHTQRKHPSCLGLFR